MSVTPDHRGELLRRALRAKRLCVAIASAVSIAPTPSFAIAALHSPLGASDARAAYQICAKAYLREAAHPESIRFLNASQNPTAFATLAPDGSTFISIEIDVVGLLRNRGPTASSFQCLITTVAKGVTAIRFVAK